MEVALAALYAFLLIVRVLLALRHAGPQKADDDGTFIQPILSGDPLLESTLAHNLAVHPDAEFIWMVDEDDEEAQRIGALYARPNLRVVIGPAPQNGENPKLAKLIRALPQVMTKRLTVLDDDTFLPESLPAGELVTGLPIFVSKSSIYERLIGGFVNGNALLTYLPAAQLNVQRTINGMIYALDAKQVRAFGGFAAAGHELTDDYAVARLYRRNGISITQSSMPAFVAMTVGTAAQYIRVMRRWMIFARRYFGDNRAAFLWISVAAALPLAGLFISPPLWLAILAAKALINRVVLWRVTGVRSTPFDLFFECASDLLTPALVVLAFVRPRRLTWRTRNIELSRSGGKIQYK